MKTHHPGTLPAHEQAAREARAATEHRHVPAASGGVGPNSIPARRPDWIPKLPERPYPDAPGCGPDTYLPGPPERNHFTRFLNIPIF